MYDQGKPIEDVREEQEKPKESIWRHVTQRNVIIVICAFFLVWILFIDRNSVLKRHRLNQEQEKLIETKNDYIKKIEDTKKELNALDEDEYIERIAREKHLMKKDNEDIYMVTE